MLLELSLRDFAIIDNISIRFGPGLNIITGETGTGKSIIVDAINIILGGKAGSDYVKTGASEAHIEALFSTLEIDNLEAKIDELGFRCQDHELLIKRTIPSQGRGRVYINGSLATYSILAQVTEGLIDIFSQHEHQTLLREDNHLSLIDNFGRLEPLSTSLRAVYSEWNGARNELKRLNADRREKLERVDFLRFQAAEIDEAGLEPGLDKRLGEEKKVLSNAEYLGRVSQKAYLDLYEGDGSMLDGLKSLALEMDEAKNIDQTLAPSLKAVESAIHELEDVSFTLRDYSSNTIVDEQRLEAVDNVLQEISNLKRKYGGDIELILQKRAEIGAELAEISDFEVQTDALEAAISELGDKLEKMAHELSIKRRDIARRLSSTISGEFETVGLKNSRFEAVLENIPVTSSGSDKAAFLFTANPDEELKPLARVASGGELSRTMLVLKEALVGVQGASVLIFDEADSGIGGAVAEAVGRKIFDLASEHQVVCITHLPQVAKFADTHLRVEKCVVDAKTRVTVDELSSDERVEEIARMLGGMSVTEKTREAAKEMLQGSSAA